MCLCVCLCLCVCVCCVRSVWLPCCLFPSRATPGPPRCPTHRAQSLATVSVRAHHSFRTKPCASLTFFECLWVSPLLPLQPCAPVAGSPWWPGAQGLRRNSDDVDTAAPLLLSSTAVGRSLPDMASPDDHSPSAFGPSDDGTDATILLDDDDCGVGLERRQRY